MSDLSVYDVQLANGMSTQMRLSAEDAKDRGLTDKDKAKQKAVVGEIDDDYTDERAQEAMSDPDRGQPVGSRAAKKAASSDA